MESETYAIIIEDANGCIFNGTAFIVDEPNELIVTPAIVQPTSGIADGSVTRTVTGGTAAIDYSFVWTDINAGAVMVGETTNTISAIDAGNYQVDITDDNGCSTSEVIAVTNDQAPTLTVVQTDIDCFNNNTGEIEVTVNGTPPNTYTYDWDNDGAHNDNPEPIATFGIYRGNDRTGH